MKIPIKVPAVMIVNSLLVLIISSIDFYYSQRINMNLFNTLGYVGVTISCLLVPLLLFFKFLRIYNWFLFLIIVFILPISFFHIHLYEQKIDFNSISVLINTNLDESKEFLSGFLLELVISVALIILTFIIMLKYNIKSNSYGKGLSLLSLIGLIVILSYNYRSSKILNQSYGNTLINNTLLTRFPFSVLDALNKHIKSQEKLKCLSKKSEGFKFNALKSKLTPEREIFVLLIGEAARYDHWGINGYNRNTSPLLSKRDDIISFQNIITGSGLTQFSVPLLITNTDALDFDKHAQEKSIISLFSEANFRTIWLSNQDVSGAPHINVHANEADSIIYTKTLLGSTGYDEDLLINFKSIIESCNDDLFFVIHQHGSHWKYDKRYPPKFDVFKPSIEGLDIRLDDFEMKERIVNSYDNSILYSDFVINSIIKNLENLSLNSGLLYVSDHGENLYDDNKNLFGHGRNYTKYSARVPLFIWLSNAHLSLDSSLQRKLNKNVANLYSSASTVFSTMADIGGINFKNKGVSIVSDSIGCSGVYILNKDLKSELYKP